MEACALQEKKILIQFLDLLFQQNELALVVHINSCVHPRNCSLNMQNYKI